MATDKEIAFFLSSSSAVVELDLVEVIHPQFSKPFRFVRNAVDGITLPNGDFYQYYPAKITTLSSEDNLDSAIKVVVGDLSEVLPPEIKQLRATDSLSIKPTVSHYIYRSDDLSEPMKDFLNLELDDFSFNAQNSFFVAKAPAMNNTQTGRTYNVEDFPMLASFLQ